MRTMRQHTNNCGRSGNPESRVANCKMTCACWCHKPVVGLELSSLVHELEQVLVHALTEQHPTLVKDLLTLKRLGEPVESILKRCRAQSSDGLVLAAIEAVLRTTSVKGFTDGAD